MIDIPHLPAQTGPPPCERGRIQVQGQNTDDNSDHTPLVFIHEADDSWMIHGLGASGVRLPADKMVALAKSILKRAR